MSHADEDVTLDIGDLPVAVRNVSIEGQNHTSSKFIFSEIGNLSKSKTFSEMNENIYIAAENLKASKVFNDVTVVVDSPVEAKNESAIDMNIAFVLKEKSRLGFSFGINQSTDSSSTQGSVSSHVRNIIGHGDTLDLSYGTTDMKLNGSNKVISALLRDLRPFNSKYTAYVGVSSETQDHSVLSSFMNHVSNVRVGVTSPSRKHSFEYNFAHRQLTPIVPKLGAVGQAATASIVNETLLPTNKSSVRYTYRHDTRGTDVLLPNAGSLSLISTEVAGLPGSDVAFAKAEATLQHFVPAGPFTLGFTGRAGVVRPLGANGRVAKNNNELSDEAKAAYGLVSIPETPAINVVDRFTQHSMFVRGYSPAEIGPKDGADVLGGDCYTSAGVSLTAPFPYSDTSIKPHIFFNSGNLISLADWLSTPKDSRARCPLSQGNLSTIGGGIVIPTVLGRLELNMVSAIKNNKVSKPKFSLVAGMDY